MSRFNLPSRKAFILGGAALLLPASLLFAGARGALGATGAGFGGLHEHGAVMHRVAEKLGLSDAQKSEIRDIFKGHRDELKGEMEKVRAARQDQFSAIHADAFDEGAIRAASAKLAESEADLAVTRGKIASEVREVLTPDQRTQAKELLKDAQALRNKMFGRFHQRLDDGDLGGDS